jgi:hypothetical protein
MEGKGGGTGRQKGVRTSATSPVCSLNVRPATGDPTTRPPATSVMVVALKIVHVWPMRFCQVGGTREGVWGSDGVCLG